MRRASYEMRTPPEIREFCERRYIDLLQAIIENRSIFPLEIRFGKTRRPNDFESLRKQVTALANSGLNFSIDWTEVNTRRWGRQRLPERIWFDQELEFVRAIGKQQEVERFKSNVARIRHECPELEGWLLGNVRCLINEDGSWPDILEVCRYFLQNPRPGLYPRELPISVSTKFIESHSATIASLLDFLLPQNVVSSAGRFEERHGLRFDEALLRLRFLDDGWRVDHGFPVSDLSVPLSEFCKLRLQDSNVLITENKVNFLTVPRLERGVAIFGGGEGVQLLGKAAWLRKCRLTYWGDIDAQGFSILSRLRSAFPGVESVMMDQKTLDTFRDLICDGLPAREAPPSNLTAGERQTYDIVVASNLRLEQEKLPFSYAAHELQVANRNP